MNSSTSGLENNCSLAKNILSFKEAIGGLFYGQNLKNNDIFVFADTIKDALNGSNQRWLREREREREREMTRHDGAQDIANKYEATVQGYNPIKLK